MSLTDPREIQKALSEPFSPEDLEWRLQLTIEEKMCGLAVPYVTNRAIQSRLDEVVGPENWHNEYKPWHISGKKESQICGISIHFENRGWVTKWDGAEDTDIEPIKGGLSDSMKRSAVHWGIGRVLYIMDTVWVDVEKRGRSFVIKNSKKPKLTKAYISMLDSLHLNPSKPTGIQTDIAQKYETPKQNVILFPEVEYIVVDFSEKKSATSSGTSLILSNSDGKKIQAFARGVLQDIYKGAELYNVSLVTKKQNNVVFHLLEAYEVIHRQNIA